MLTLGVTEADDQAYMRWKFESSDADDFSTFAPKLHGEDKYFTTAAATPEGGEPPVESPAKKAPPRINGGALPPKAPNKVMTISDIYAQTPAWRADPANREAINVANGVPHLNRKS